MEAARKMIVAAKAYESLCLPTQKPMKAELAPRKKRRKAYESLEKPMKAYVVAKLGNHRLSGKTPD